MKKSRPPFPQTGLTANESRRLLLRFHATGLMKTASALVLLLAFLGGCASTPEAPLQDDAAAKRFESAPRAAIVYLYRADASGSAGISTIWVDDRLVGQTLPATYFRFAVRPGHNRIAAFAGDQGRLEIDTREGGVYFVAMHVGGEGESSPNTVFRVVSPDAGKAAILRCCTLLETWRPGQRRLTF